MVEPLALLALPVLAYGVQRDLGWGVAVVVALLAVPVLLASPVAALAVAVGLALPHPLAWAPAALLALPHELQDPLPAIVAVASLAPRPDPRWVALPAIGVLLDPVAAAVALAVGGAAWTVDRYPARGGLGRLATHGAPLIGAGPGMALLLLSTVRPFPETSVQVLFVAVAALGASIGLIVAALGAALRLQASDGQGAAAVGMALGIAVWIGVALFAPPDVERTLGLGAIVAAWIGAPMVGRAAVEGGDRLDAWLADLVQRAQRLRERLSSR